MAPLNRYIYQPKRDGFVANGFDIKLQIYITIASHYEKYIDISELQFDKSGSAAANAFFNDLIAVGVVKEILEWDFRQILQTCILEGFRTDNRVGDRFEKYLLSEAHLRNDDILPSQSTQAEECLDLRFNEYATFNLNTCMISYHHKRRTMIVDSALDTDSSTLAIYNRIDTEERRNNFCFEYTTYYHERLHFHDYIGTNLGISLFYRNQSIINNFLCTCLPNLSSISAIKVPFVKWVRERECPTFIREFVKYYTDTHRLIDWYLGTQPEKFSCHKAGKKDLSSYRTGIDLPTVELDRVSSNWGEFPLGGLALLEGRAFEFQRRIVASCFGKEAADTMYQAICRSKGGWIYGGAYEVARSYIANMTSEDFLLLTDFALMGGDFGTDTETRHPGLRFLSILRELECCRDSKSRFKEALSELARKNNGFNTEITYERAFRYINENIADTDRKIREFPILVCLINNSFYKYAQLLSQKSSKGFSIMSDLKKYLEDIQVQISLPQPLSMELIGGQYRILDCLGDDQEEIFGYKASQAWFFWLFLQSFILQSLLNDEILCPLKQFQIDCPLKVDDCGTISLYGKSKVGEMCVWGTTVESLGCQGLIVLR